MDAAGLARFLCAQGADLCYSRFARNAAGLCGFGYITRTGNMSRLAGMGVVGAARRTGVARTLLLQLLEEAKGRGDRAMILEVIEQNPSARALYLRASFRELNQLSGWRRAAGTNPGEPAATVQEISPTAASQLPGALEFPELPWAISRHAAAKLAAGRAYFSGRALVILDDSGSEPGPLRVCLLSSCHSGEMDWSGMREALAGVLKLHSDREFIASPVFPEIFGEKIFAPLGFLRQSAISQFLMRYDF